MELSNISYIKNIQKSQISLLTRFFVLMNNGNVDAAQTLITENGLEDYILSADNMNELIDLVSSSDIDTGVEAYIINYISTNVDTKLSDLLTDFQTNIDNIKNVGEWSSTTTYYAGNCVTYNDASYYCTVNAPVGTLPTNTTYFVNIYLGMIMNNVETAQYNDSFMWSSTVTYPKGALVVNSGENVAYVSLQDNNLNNELTDTAYWSIFLGIENGTIRISATEPTNILDGDLWIQIT